MVSGAVLTGVEPPVPSLGQLWLALGQREPDFEELCVYGNLRELGTNISGTSIRRT